MKEYPLRVVACQPSWGAIKHLTLSNPINMKTLCGKRWEYVTNKTFNSKIDCQQCRKQQEALA